MSTSVCYSCRWREWYIEVSEHSQILPVFVDECPLHPQEVMKIFQGADCNDYAPVEET